VSRGAKGRKEEQADNEFDWVPEEDELVEDKEQEGGDDASEVDADEFSRIERDAKTWDRFLQLVHAMRPFERDDLQYRKERAVETFNAAAGVMKEYKRLNPSAMSACPHVALCVLPRQQVEHGDHHRRGTDQGEALGASVKDTLHRRTLRRRKGVGVTKHRKRGADGSVEKSWTQRALQVSRVMQVFRSMTVTELVFRDEDSAPYLQRKHCNLGKTGFTTAAGPSKCTGSAKSSPDEDAIFSKCSAAAIETIEMA